MPAKAGISIREYVRGFRLGGRNDKSGKSQLLEPFDSAQGDAGGQGDPGTSPG